MGCVSNDTKKYMNKPLISVIVVCRNVGESVEGTIKDIRKQIYSNIELIVIDGASTDNTIFYIERCMNLVDIYLSEPDRGIYDAMNKGLRLASGTWVSFINVGDFFADENVVSSIFDNDEIPEQVKLIGGNTCNYFPDGHVEIHHAETADVIPYRLPFSHQACFTRRELIKDQGSFQFDCQYHFAADYNLFYYIYHKFGASAIKTLDRAIARYKQEGSTSMINHRKAKKEYLKIQSVHLNMTWVKEIIKYFFKR